MRHEIRGFIIAILAGVAVGGSQPVKAQPGPTQPRLPVPAISPRADDPIPAKRLPPVPDATPSPRQVPRIKSAPKQKQHSSWQHDPRPSSRSSIPLDSRPLDSQGVRRPMVHFHGSRTACDAVGVSGPARTSRRRGLLVELFSKRNPCNCPHCRAARSNVNMQPIRRSHVPPQQAQTGRSRRSQMVFQLDDFHPNTARLNISGAQRAVRIAKLLPTNIYPVLIATSQDPKLDEERRRIIGAVLQSTDFPLPDQRIIVQQSTQRSTRGRQELEQPAR